ncbi:MAG: histidine phosphatase family protein [Clostridiales bacterium]|jgi:broad specificity phosphatase PhoE|nr:histidine phosphatase family protein [Clostridiales bacterium]
MRLFLTRHGESTYNAEGRYAGSTDVPLSETGVRQARELAVKLKDTAFDVIISSALARARQTADIINEYHNLGVIAMEGFNERNIGVFEGLTRKEAMERYPQVWERRSTRAVDDAPDGGETIRQVNTRVSVALRRLKEEYTGKKALLVCHGFTARVINRIINNLAYEDMHGFTLDNCEVAEYEL